MYTYCLKDADGDWWVYDDSGRGVWHMAVEPKAFIPTAGFDAGVHIIVTTFGIKED